MLILAKYTNMENSEYNLELSFAQAGEVANLVLCWI